MPASEKMIKATHTLLIDATAPQRVEARERAMAFAQQRVDNMSAKLAEHGWNIDKAAPYPSGNVGRNMYAAMQSLRTSYGSVTQPADKSGSHRWGEPKIVEMSPKAVKAFIEQAGRDSDVNFDAYLVKLTGKLVEFDEKTPVTDAKVDGAHIWDGSVLTVTRKDGSVEKWKTTMILNVSKLGLVFNQFPTRKQKTK